MSLFLRPARRELAAALLFAACVPDVETAADSNAPLPPDTLSSVALVEGGASESEIPSDAPRPVSGPSPDAEPDASRSRAEAALPSPTGRLLPPVALIDRDPTAYLRALDLLVPVAGTSRADLPPSSFSDARGQRRHEAYDIHAPRGTPVLAVTDGSLAKLHVSEAGGNMVYTYDASERFVIFYAHLDRYHPGLAEGMPLQRGDTLGYVGTTGNAPPGVPHLHFAIMLMDEDRRWWKGTPIDPQPILTDAGR